MADDVLHTCAKELKEIRNEIIETESKLMNLKSRENSLIQASQKVLKHIKKDYKIISNQECEDANMYQIIDVMDIKYNGTHIDNSIEAINIVLQHYEEFCIKNNINCGNLYICEFSKNQYFGVCDGLSEYDYNTENDNSIEFGEYCRKIGLITDDRHFD